MIIIGNIYNFGDSIVRPILSDEIEVFYEPWSKSDDEWYFKRARNVSFFRTSAKCFQDNSKLIREEILSPKEKELFRPDLPMRLNRFKNTSWTKTVCLDMDKYRAYMEKSNITLSNILGLDVSSIFLYPIGPSGGRGKAIIVDAKNQNTITGIELLISASNIQAPYVREQSEGIGIFRLGYRQKRPTYYIGGYHDQAGNTSEQ